MSRPREVVSAEASTNTDLIELISSSVQTSALPEFRPQLSNPPSSSSSRLLSFEEIQETATISYDIPTPPPGAFSLVFDSSEGLIPQKIE
mmetsp:Transcript_18251/g.28064  ORF Transcript_18251/g.28064 Transcript_18251/m.28064 type:complete len:90 (-) Transcript_18251:939-1208(-)